MQGFDPKQITGGCSGALRQEFRELEILDEVTRLRFIGKLPSHVEGITRNSIISSFRKWKGNQYVPSTVHSSIRWSTRSPWMESEILNLDDRLALLEKMSEKRKKGNREVDKPERSLASSKVVAQLGLGKPNTQKRRRSSGLPRLLSATSTHPSNKQKVVSPPGIPNGRHYSAPVGMRWSQNSCAYDSVFTPIYVQWCANRNWQEYIRRKGSPAANLLVDGFIRYEAGQGTLESARDAVRRYMARSQSDAVFGAYASIWEVCNVLLKMNEIIWEKFYLCPNGHNVLHSDDSRTLLSAAIQFASIAQWASVGTEQTTTRCRVCRCLVSIQLKLRTTPPLLAFEFSAQPTININHSLSLQLENRVQKYSLTTVIYYSHNHFTTQIITRDGRVWFYDGMLITDPTVEPTLHCTGSINDPSFDVQVCRGASPCAAFYCL